MSQAALAKKARTSRSEINGIEAGQRAPTIVSLDHLSRALGVPVTAFFSDEKPPAKRATPQEVALERLLLRLRDHDLAYLGHVEAFLRWFERTRT